MAGTEDADSKSIFFIKASDELKALTSKFGMAHGVSSILVRAYPSPSIQPDRSLTLLLRTWSTWQQLYTIQHGLPTMAFRRSVVDDHHRNSYTLRPTTAITASCANALTAGCPNKAAVISFHDCSISPSLKNASMATTTSPAVYAIPREVELGPCPRRNGTSSIPLMSSTSGIKFAASPTKGNAQTRTV